MDHPTTTTGCNTVCWSTVSLWTTKWTNSLDSDFTKMADRLSIFGLVEMLREANWTLQSNQTALAEYFTQRVSMSEETITEVQIAGFKSETSASRTFANIALGEMGEMKRKLQQYEEKYGPL